MCTKFDIYVFIHCTTTDLSLSRDTNSINCGFQTTTEEWKLHRSVCYSSPGFHCLKKSSSHYLAAILFNIRTPCAITQRNHFQYQGDRGDNLIQSLLTYLFYYINFVLQILSNWKKRLTMRNTTGILLEIGTVHPSLAPRFTPGNTTGIGTVHPSLAPRFTPGNTTGIGTVHPSLAPRFTPGNTTGIGTVHPSLPPRFTPGLLVVFVLLLFVFCVVYFVFFYFLLCCVYPMFPVS